MTSTVRGALMLSMMPASVEWLRLKLGDLGADVSARTIQRDLVAMEQVGLVARDTQAPTLTRWRRIR